MQKLTFMGALAMTLMSMDTMGHAGLAEGRQALTANPDNKRHNPYPVQAPYDGIYAHAVETSSKGRYLHISGQLGFSPDGQLPEDFSEQARAAITNLESTLRAAKMSLADIVHMRFLLTDRADIDALVKIRKDMLDGLAPAVTTHLVGGLLREEWLIEIEAVAFQASP